jgi:hypothetical protein
LLAVFNVLALLSIGLFVLPVTAALVVASLTWPPARSRGNPAARQAATG